MKKRSERKQMKRWACVMCAGLFPWMLGGCGDKVPGDVIQPVEMENLLYDYQVATTLSGDLSYSENYKKKAYIEYVFRKHHVTEAEFDSSMVWYSRHGEQLSLIYDNLQKRFEIDRERVKQQTERLDGEIVVSLSGDTVDIWQDRTLYWLTASPYTNKVLFDLKADTSFKPKDILMFEAGLSFLPEKKRGGRAVMALNVTFKNDSTQGITRVTENSGVQRLFLRPDSAFEFKNVSGFVYYMPSDGDSAGSVLVDDIRLIRTHVLPAKKESSSSMKTGRPATHPDSVSRRVSRKPHADKG